MIKRKVNNLDREAFVSLLQSVERFIQEDVNYWIEYLHIGVSSKYLLRTGNLVFYRYKNANNERIRKHVLKRIEEGKTEWKSLLEDFPLPDKPFKIEDVENERMFYMYSKYRT